MGRYQWLFCFHLLHFLVLVLLCFYIAMNMVREEHLWHGESYNLVFGSPPAYAGNTTSTQFIIMSGREHPSIRGEYTLARLPQSATLGSPPHTRGIRLLKPNAIAAVAITPAYAGNTIYAPCSLFYIKDHPRIRGEYTQSNWATRGGLGSPPHTRGIRHPAQR